MKKTLRLDSAETAWFEDEFKHVQARVLEKEYPSLKAVQLFPPSSMADPADEIIEFYVMDKVGVAKFISNYANDLPTVDIRSEKHVAHIRGIGDSFVYSVMDVKKSAKVGRSLSAQKAIAARDAIELKIDLVGWDGDTDYNLIGILNHPNINVITAPFNSGGSVDADRLWENKSEAEILLDLNTIANHTFKVTNGTEQVDSMAMSIDSWTIARTTPLSAINPNVTIMKFFLENNDHITTVETVHYLEDHPWVSDPGKVSGDLLLVWQDSSDALVFEIPLPFEQLDPTREGLVFEVVCHARVCGMIIYKPLTVTVMEGI